MSESVRSGRICDCLCVGGIPVSLATFEQYIQQSEANLSVA